MEPAVPAEPTEPSEHSESPAPTGPAGPTGPAASAGITASSPAGSLGLRAAVDRPCPHGGVILAATPLGTALDASVRLIDALGSADIVAAEDTRRTRALADALGVEITGRMVSNFDHNESDRAAGLVTAAASGARVLVVTDAGMPAVSDPGFPLVRAAQEAGVPVTCLPGPSAVPTALALSGVGVGHFAFDGFAPRRDGDRRRWLETLRDERRAVAFFESPHRLRKTLDVAVEILGADREAAVCRELTKTHEEVLRAPLGELAGRVAAVDDAASDGHGPGVRGEITVVISGAPERGPVDPASLVTVVEQKVASGMRLKDACREVAAGHGASRRELYEAVLAARR
ncbi:16S rRNA (cytidine(1402)-2'-O)-methyltransferase [Corynebacterium neomassiliense]|uniref:16S rRNA (cytidine(1402)-2'-O)-methyltransferase n=1 Tax=Corynebacterium neomassiliense TaxID=2079482 RepID=UPI00102F938B|nr:16S rRNA (cytidine(1402)-2'-O)-methyltransferase [Corynebacterium neomassiliense]